MKFNYMDKTMPEDYKLKYPAIYKPDEIALLYSELKMLSFESAMLFKPKLINSISSFKQHFDEAAKDPKIKVIIVDSLIRISEIVINYTYKKYTNSEAWLRWGDYGRIIPNMIKDTLKTNKVIIWIGLSETKYDSSGELKDSIQISGKKLKGEGISSYFSIVLWTNVDKTASVPFYKYRLSHERINNDARALEGLFLKDYIPNDINYIFHRLMKYFHVNHIDEMPIKPQLFIAGDTGTGKTNMIRRICIPNDNET